MFTIYKYLGMYSAARIYHIWEGSGYKINEVIDVHREMCVFLITAKPSLVTHPAL